MGCVSANLSSSVVGLSRFNKSRSLLSITVFLLTAGSYYGGYCLDRTVAHILLVLVGPSFIVVQLVLPPLLLS